MVGPLTGFFREGPAEIVYDIQWGYYGFQWLPFGSVLAKMSPFSIGFPEPAVFIQALPIALMSYVILFGDIITGTEIVKSAEKARPDEQIDINSNRSHLSLAIRNAKLSFLKTVEP